ncbi:hypothetical protein [Bradyrhizobium sp. AUGA SZCCT0042]|uniref:hypothetical protein n=1 Tax=Bradyrhizobium sp. AUGA SZCCT0042 TaxID=2807651 RepID=UPI001BA61169|nr:hypothetical protein [Bradyrhizobium sp. AUGA SZCCT0042]MBR1296630.1 hypothetical protein [Bradyrhizobium sp. AUGA SZCCT0042]
MYSYWRAILLLISLTFSGSGFAATTGMQAVNAHDLALKSTEALNDIAKRIPPLLKEVMDSGSAVIDEIKKPGCQSDTFRLFQQNVVTTNDFADELERARLKVIQHGDHIQDQIQPGDPPIADQDLITWVSNIEGFERHSKEILDVVHRTKQAVWDAVLMRDCSDHAVDEYLSSSKPDTFTFRGSQYAVPRDPSTEHFNCLYRNQKKLLCSGEFITIEKHVVTKDYDLIVLSTGELGSGTRWWDWRLVVDMVRRPLSNRSPTDALDATSTSRG